MDNKEWIETQRKVAAESKEPIRGNLMQALDRLEAAEAELADFHSREGDRERRLLAEAAIRYAEKQNDRANGKFEPDGPRSTGELERLLKEYQARRAAEGRPGRHDWKHDVYGVSLV